MTFRDDIDAKSFFSMKRQQNFLCCNISLDLEGENVQKKIRII
jgi:hypothetical protein